MSSLYGDLPPASGEQPFPTAEGKKPAAPKPAMAPLVPSTLSKKPPAIPRVLVAAAAAVKAKSSASFLTSAGTAIQTSSSPLVPSSVVRPTGDPSSNHLNPTKKKKTISQPHSVPADSHVIQLDVINEYNPLLPNDYDEYCQEREAAKLREEQQREEEERARQLRKDMERMQRERSKTGTGAKTEHLQISSGEEAFLRRARMSGQSVPATSAPPPPQAPANPLEAVARRKRMRPSSCGCIVMLLNMVGRGEVDAELERETAEECDKYGKVVSCVVSEDKDATIPESEVVCILVEFDSVSSARTAASDLDGRYFGGRQVRALMVEREHK